MDAGHAGRGAVLAEDLAERAGPFADGAPSTREVDGGRHQVLVARRAGLQAVEGARHRPVVAVVSPPSQMVDLLGFGGGVGDQDVFDVVGDEGGRRSLGEPVDADDGDRTALDGATPGGVTLHQAALHGVDHLEGTAAVEDPLELGRGRLLELGGLGLEGPRRHLVLLDPQRPLLVPRPGKPQGLVPGRELQGAGAGVAGQGDAEGLEDDALHVVLRLRLGETE